MDKQIQIWKLISRSLSEDIPVILLYVVHSFGSSPGRQGFFMAVNATGEMEGSIGGGVMEHKFVELAKERLRFNQMENSIRKQVHDKEALKNQSGMICSGEQTIVLYSLTKADTGTIQSIIIDLEANNNAALRLTPSGLSFSERIPEQDYHYNYKSDDDWKYEEKLGYKNYLHIVGAGHCSLALSKLAAGLDFHITLYDDRTGLNTFDNNQFVHTKKLLNDYGQVKDLLSDGRQYVVVMTMGYRTDDQVLRGLFHRNLQYVGILGSKTKIEKMFSTYRKEGIADQLLNKIHAPIGIEIYSQTPEEIAVSIAAEIIKVKNAVANKL